jgi:hypothetical protein
MRIAVPFIIAIAIVLAPGRADSDDGRRLSRQPFEKLHAQLKRQPHESRWMEIDWYPSVWEARKQAAEQGKPLFLWAGSGGAPAAGC